MAKEHEVPLAKKTAMQGGRGGARQSPTLPAGPSPPRTACWSVFRALATYSRLNAWGKGRENPQPPGESFHLWWAKNRTKNPTRTRAGNDS